MEALPSGQLPQRGQLPLRLALGVHKMRAVGHAVLLQQQQQPEGGGAYGTQRMGWVLRRGGGGRVVVCRGSGAEEADDCKDAVQISLTGSQLSLVRLGAVLGVPPHRHLKLRPASPWSSRRRGRGVSRSGTCAHQQG